MTATVADAHTILAERARQLARPLTEINDATDSTSSLLVVTIGDERIGIALDHITEVHRPKVLTPIPGARAPVVGVIAWRGRVLTVLDVAHSRRAPLKLTDSTRILVLGTHNAAFGIVADDVDDVEGLDSQDIVPVEDVSPARSAFVLGTTANALVVLDAAALITRFAPPQMSTGGPRE